MPLARCARVASAADDALVAFAGAGDEPRGVLRVNAPIVFAEEYLVDPIAKYLEKYRDVRVELAVNDRAIDLVEERTDVAVRITARLGGTGLVARRLASDTPLLCASPAYLARRGTPASPEELVHHDCVTYSLLEISDEWRFKQPGTKELLSVAIEPRFSAASGALVRRAAVAGLGIADLPSFLVSDAIESGSVEPLLGDYPMPEHGIHVVRPPGAWVPGKVRVLVDALLERFGGEPVWDRCLLKERAGKSPAPE